MNTEQFCLMTYQWIFATIVPAIAPGTWQQQLIAFSKGHDLMGKLSSLASSLAKDASGGIDLTDLESRLGDMFKIDPVFAFPINEPSLALIGLPAEHILKFSRADLDSFLAHIRGNTVSTHVAL